MYWNMYFLCLMCLYFVYSINVDAFSLHSSSVALKSRPLIRGVVLKPLSLSRSPSSVEDVNIPKLQPRSSPVQKVSHALKIMYKFSRPHTIKGTILASIMGVTRALLDNPIKLSTSLISRAFIGLTALLCGNAFIVGINQIYDVQIDEINKPFLPIAAKSMSPLMAWSIILFCLVSGVVIVYNSFSPLIFRLYILGLILGTSYSVPPLQLKRAPILAGSIIAFVRGFLLNFGVYYAVREALSIPFHWNPVVLFISIFMTIFASVIAVTKDLSDVEGDKRFNISTFASQYGVHTIARAATITLSLAYLFAMVLPFFPVTKPYFRPLPMVLGHGIAMIHLWRSYQMLDVGEMDSIKKFYKSIWTAFYGEYLLYPFI